MSCLSQVIEEFAAHFFALDPTHSSFLTANFVYKLHGIAWSQKYSFDNSSSQKNDDTFLYKRVSPYSRAIKDVLSIVEEINLLDVFNPDSEDIKWNIL
jgi:hypothetical protein